MRRYFLPILRKTNTMMGPKIDPSMPDEAVTPEYLAENLWSERARSAADRRYFEYPMLRRIVERSRAVIVHNPDRCFVIAVFVALNHIYCQL